MKFMTDFNTILRHFKKKSPGTPEDIFSKKVYTAIL
ncbi:MAG: hypothetical protein ACD_80C00092G0006 [uncultured bacterium (gcode 4)]|uniref:Uncharacterized protein n=1 Tax=uncultured bacterium (gcode 4) TaxID=1234023 RepID=K1XJ91_9BACT|nr:MAG: hypothetical protein ACD_80C00092G0006 [uncultured bacterium (gcode 4)]